MKNSFALRKEGRVAFFGALFAGVFKVPFVVAMHEIQPEHEGKVIGHVGRAGLEI